MLRVPCAIKGRAESFYLLFPYPPLRWEERIPGLPEPPQQQAGWTRMLLQMDENPSGEELERGLWFLQLGYRSLKVVAPEKAGREPTWVLSLPGSGAPRGRKGKFLQCWLPGQAWPSLAAMGHLRPDHGSCDKSPIHMEVCIHMESSEDQGKLHSEGGNSLYSRSPAGALQL